MVTEANHRKNRKKKHKKRNTNHYIYQTSQKHRISLSGENPGLILNLNQLMTNSAAHRSYNFGADLIIATSHHVDKKKMSLILWVILGGS